MAEPIANNALFGKEIGNTSNADVMNAALAMMAKFSADAALSGRFGIYKTVSQAA